MIYLTNDEVPDYIRWDYNDEPYFCHDRRGYYIKHNFNKWSFVAEEEKLDFENGPKPPLLARVHTKTFDPENLICSSGTIIAQVSKGKFPDDAPDGSLHLDSRTGKMYVHTGGNSWQLLEGSSGTIIGEASEDIRQGDFVKTDPDGKISPSNLWDSSFATMDGGR